MNMNMNMNMNIIISTIYTNISTDTDIDVNITISIRRRHYFYKLLVLIWMHVYSSDQIFCTSLYYKNLYTYDEEMREGLKFLHLLLYTLLLQTFKN